MDLCLFDHPFEEFIVACPNRIGVVHHIEIVSLSLCIVVKQRSVLTRHVSFSFRIAKSPGQQTIRQGGWPPNALWRYRQNSSASIAAHMHKGCIAPRSDAGVSRMQ